MYLEMLAWSDQMSLQIKEKILLIRLFLVIFRVDDETHVFFLPCINQHWIFIAINSTLVLKNDKINELAKTLFFNVTFERVLKKYGKIYTILKLSVCALKLISSKIIKFMKYFIVMMKFLHKSHTNLLMCLLKA